MSACSTQNNTQLNNFRIKNINSDVLPSSAPADLKTLINPPIDATSFSKEIIGTNNTVPQDTRKTNFSTLPPDDEPTISGSLSVIYKNFNKIRINKVSNTVVSFKTDDAIIINNIFKKYSVTNISDNAFPNVSEEEFDKIQEISSKASGSEIPHAHSIQTYHFPKGTDTKLIANDLRKLDFVVTAYPSVMCKPTLVTATKLAPSQTPSTTIFPSNSNPVRPNDFYFSNLSESDIWWYNREKIFHAQDLYGSTQVPSIAIIDSGFDTDANYAYDKPNYVLPGLSVQYTAANGYQLGNDVREYASDHPGVDYSHGTNSACIAASPRDNINQYGPSAQARSGASGVAPSANIYPIKLIGSYSEQAVAHAIFQASYMNVDVISISLGTGNDKPISLIPSIRNEINNAYSVRNKIVVISAGNNSNNDISDTNSAYNTTNFPDSAEIIVGGTEDIPSIGRSKAFTSGTGSTYGNRIHLAAAANGMWVPSFNPINGNRAMSLTAGTSNACPIVAAVAGMMKRIAAANGNNNLTALQIRSQLIYSSNLATYNAPSGNNPPVHVEKFLGFDLSNPDHNVDRVSNGSPTANVRELNAYNALLLAKYLHQYPLITRVFNIDDNIQTTDAHNWQNYYGYEGYGNDAFWGINGLSTGGYLDFRTYNSGGGRAFGYQVYKQGINQFDYVGGVTGVSGAYNNAGSSAGWYDTYSYQNY